MKFAKLLGALCALFILSPSLEAQSQSLPYRETLIDHWARHVPTALSHYGWVASVKYPHSGFYWDAINPVLSPSFSAFQELVIQGINSAHNYVAYDLSAGWSGMGNLYMGAMIQLPQFPSCGQGFRVPLALSETDVIAGFAVCPGVRPRAMIYKSGSYVTISGLSGPDSTAEDISPSGRYVVGWQGTLNSSYSPPPIDSSAGAGSKYAYGVSDPTRAYRYDLDQGQLSALTSQIVGLPAGAQVLSTTALATNDDGAVVGYVTYKLSGSNYERPVLWPNPNAGWSLPMPTTYSHGCRATSINSAWQVVASCFKPAVWPQQTQEAFVWDATHGSRLLNPHTQNPTAGYLSATDINDYGQITVSVDNGTYDPGVALLTPTTVPFGACMIAGQCHPMRGNQCDGHGGQFSANVLCQADPGPIELEF